MASPFVCNYNDKEKCPCKGCQRNMEKGALRIGLVRGQGSSMRNDIDWYHTLCFWEKCPYRHHVRGTNMDRMAMIELFVGFDSLMSHDKQRLELDASKPAYKFKRKHRNIGLVAANGDDDVSVDGGDYELADTTFDLTNLICINVFKPQLDTLVSIREYFKPNDALVAKATRTGICLTVDQWHKLCRKRYGIDIAIKDMDSSKEQRKKKEKGNKGKKEDENGDSDDEEQVVFSLSWKRRVSIYKKKKEPVVDIRDFSEEKTFKPAKRGITLSKTQWNKVKCLIDSVNYSILTMT